MRSLMNTKPRWWVAFSVILAGCSSSAFAFPMIPANVPFITIQATQPLASEPGNNPAEFTLSRLGGTNSVTVTYNIGGTAKNGVDYVAITNSITLAAGETATNIVITPISETNATGYKTVVLTLPRNTRPFAESAFIVGPVSRAVAYIAYNYTNVPPTVSIVAPTNGRSYLSRPNITISANAYDSNGWITAVEFMTNGTEIGTVSNGTPSIFMRESHGFVLPEWPGSHGSRYNFVWTNVAPGNYSLTAVAVDNAGLQTTSGSVDITVTTNLPTPAVRIVSPMNGAEFPDQAPVNIYAAAVETNGLIKTVEFLANSNSLGVVSNYLAAEPVGPFQSRIQWLPYFFQWTNAPVGTNILTTIATDNNGLQATSTPVSITVTTNIFHSHHWR